MKDWSKWRLRMFKILRGYSLLNKLRSLRIYELTYWGKIDTWDYQWDFLAHKKGGKSLIPYKNLITNLGFIEGTHTTNYNKKKKTLEKRELEFPLRGFSKKTDYFKSYVRFFR
jgi:hypothetical protein